MAFDIADVEGARLAPNALVLSGASLSLGNVVAVMDDGTRVPLVASEDYRVEIAGGTWNASTAQILLSANRQAIPVTGYEVAIILAQVYQPKT